MLEVRKVEQSLEAPGAPGWQGGRSHLCPVQDGSLRSEPQDHGSSRSPCWKTSTQGLVPPEAWFLHTRACGRPQRAFPLSEHQPADGNRSRGVLGAHDGAPGALTQG